LGITFTAFPALTQAGEGKIYLVGKLAKYKTSIEYLVVFTPGTVIRKYADVDRESFAFIESKQEAEAMPEPALEEGAVGLRKVFISSGLMGQAEADKHFEDFLPTNEEREVIETSRGFHSEGNMVRIDGVDHSLNCYKVVTCENASCNEDYACH
jgi:hypothetical protein